MVTPLRSRLIIPITIAAVLALAGCSTSTATSEPGATTPVPAAPGANTSVAPSSDQPAASQGLPQIETDFPPACEIATVDELAAIVGNPLADGVGFTNLTCDWEGDADLTSVALLLQPIRSAMCGEGLPDGESTDQFGVPASVGYGDAGNVPGAQVGACIHAGLVLVTVTGGYGAESDEARYTGQAVGVMELVLGRL